MTVLAAAAIQHTSSKPLLVIAALIGIGVVVVLITVLKVHPFLSLILGSVALGAIAQISGTDIITSFTNGFGATMGSVGLLIAFGAMIGGLLTASGGADRVVTSIVGRVGPRALPWAMGGVAALIAIPLFFEVGVVLLIPIVLLVARQSNQSVLRVGIPALAGLSVLHGFIPPHPGPLVAIANLHADLGLVLIFGLIVAVPCVILAGPVFGTLISRRIHVEHPAVLVGTAGSTTEGRATGTTGSGDRGGLDDTDLGQPVETGTQAARTRTLPARTGLGGSADQTRRPSLAATLFTVMLPIALILAKAIADLVIDDKNNGTQSVLDVVGNSAVALLIGVVVAMFTLGTAIGFDRARVSSTVGGALPAIAGIFLIVAAGGGFKQLLVDSGVSGLVADAAKGANLSPLVLGWLVAVGIRLATGSATVATVTAAGIVAPLAAGLNSPTVALLALAVGAGSLFFSHVNDAGFWLVKEYFGMSVGQTIASWSVMETIISVVGLAGVLIISIFV